MPSNETPAHASIPPSEPDVIGFGRIEISDGVIATIAGQAATKVEGIHVVGSSFRLSEFLGGRDSARAGVNVKTAAESGHVEINLEVNVDYGVSIYDKACELQKLIKEEIEALTGTMMVDKVNIRVKQLVVRQRESELPVTPDKAFEQAFIAESEEESRG